MNRYAVLSVWVRLQIKLLSVIKQILYKTTLGKQLLMLAVPSCGAVVNTGVESSSQVGLTLLATTLQKG